MLFFQEGYHLSFVLFITLSQQVHIEPRRLSLDQLLTTRPRPHRCAIYRSAVAPVAIPPSDVYSWGVSSRVASARNCRYIVACRTDPGVFARTDVQ